MLDLGIAQLVYSAVAVYRSETGQKRPQSENIGRAAVASGLEGCMKAGTAEKSIVEQSTCPTNEGFSGSGVDSYCPPCFPAAGDLDRTRKKSIADGLGSCTRYKVPGIDMSRMQF